MSILYFLKKKKLVLEVRELLFGDVPIAQWPGRAVRADKEPWLSFARARDLLEKDDTPAAVALFHEILAMPGLESRHYAQAWHFLRQAGEQPEPPVAKQLLGVIVEVGMPKGLDILVAYPDGTARYFNHANRAVIWDAPDDSLKELIDAVLAVGQQVAERIGPWERERPGPPKQGQARISMLTPSGIHFGQADMETMSQDPLGGSVLAAATELMKAMIHKTAPAPK